MTDRDALSAAVLAGPDDDLPRLVYADWLEEHGDPDRAGFIRHQIDAARAEPYSPAWRAATAAADALLARHRDDWAGHLGRVADRVDFARGLVEGVAVRAARFPGAAAGLFAAAPVRAVWLTGLDDDPFGPGPFEIIPAELFRTPELRRVRRLTVGPGLLAASEDFADLARAPDLAGVTDLALPGNPVDPPWLTRFLAGDAFPDLAGLDLSDIPHLGPAVARGLAAAGHRRLVRLDLSGVAMRSRDLQQMLEARPLREVEELRLRSADPRSVWPASHLNLGWLVPWDRLRVLDLGGQGVGNDGCGEIARAPAAGSLRWLGLAANHLGPEAVRLLAESPYLNLYHLDVRGNGLGPKDVAALRDRFPEAVVLA
ncbi:MAG: TIGR02996 domain-containing protein [Gemmataceae bacterium]|nr:TIGR02996 domain-containing protein [Gemmataceae bacterium]